MASEVENGECGVFEGKGRDYEEDGLISSVKR